MSVGLQDDEEVDWTMTGITGDLVPLPCFIDNAMVGIEGVLVYIRIFTSPAEEGGFVLGRAFKREALLQWDYRAEASMWGTVTSSNSATRARFKVVNPRGARNSALDENQGKKRGSVNMGVPTEGHDITDREVEEI